MLERTPLFAESWNVAWREKPCGTLLEDRDTPFEIIPNSIRYWAADPFLFVYHGETYIFAELYDYITRKGGLGYCKWNGKCFDPWKKVISETYHLSYPCIFEHDGSIYILPESGANYELYLYRAIRFPDLWEKDKVLRKDIKYGDTTPFVFEGFPYALAYDVKDKHHYKLILLDLLNAENDKEVEHTQVNMSRPAGKFFANQDKNFRPAQNCVKEYGRGLIFYECEIIENVYSEKPILSITPQDLRYSKKITADGIHTYNSTDSFEVIDIKTRRFNLLNLISRMIGKIGRGI